MTASTLHRSLCLIHPRREAAARCTSCGGAFCRECVTEFAGRMVCGACYKAKTEIKEKPKRDWFIVTTSFQLMLGLAGLWVTFWLLGQVLVSIPSDFHEGKVWEKLQHLRQ
jgi:hypothetical protein